MYANYNKIDKKADIACTIMSRDYKGFGTSGETQNGVIESRNEIIVAGSLNPEKTVQDRVRVLDRGGVAKL